jgi:hypothetical protein
VYYNKGWTYKLVIKKDSTQPSAENEDDLDEEAEVEVVPRPKKVRKKKKKKRVRQFPPPQEVEPLTPHTEVEADISRAPVSDHEPAGEEKEHADDAPERIKPSETRDEYMENPDLERTTIKKKKKKKKKIRVETHPLEDEPNEPQQEKEHPTHADDAPERIKPSETRENADDAPDRI